MAVGRVGAGAEGRGKSGAGGWISGCERDRLREASEPEQQEQGARGDSWFTKAQSTRWTEHQEQGSGNNLGFTSPSSFSPSLSPFVSWMRASAAGAPRGAEGQGRWSPTQLYEDLVYIVSLRYQTIHVLQIRDSGSLAEGRCNSGCVHYKLYLEHKFRDGTWEYEDLGSYFSDGELDTAAAIIFNRDHVDTPCFKNILNAKSWIWDRSNLLPKAYFTPVDNMQKISPSVLNKSATVKKEVLFQFNELVQIDCKV